MSDNPTLDALLDIKNRTSTTLYYATSDLVEKGSVVIGNLCTTIPNQAFLKYFVCHPDDLKQIKEDSPAIKFVSLSKAPLQFSQPSMKYKTRWSP